MIRLGYSCIYGDRTRRERQRKKTVRWTVFADVATSVSEAIGALRRKSPPSPPNNKDLPFVVGLCFLFKLSKYCTEQAAATYDSGLVAIVGEDGTEAAS